MGQRRRRGGGHIPQAEAGHLEHPAPQPALPESQPAFAPDVAAPLAPGRVDEAAQGERRRGSAEHAPERSGVGESAHQHRAEGSSWS